MKKRAQLYRWLLYRWLRRVSEILGLCIWVAVVEYDDSTIPATDIAVFKSKKSVKRYFSKLFGYPLDWEDEGIGETLIFLNTDAPGHAHIWAQCITLADFGGLYVTNYLSVIKVSR